MKKFFGEFRDFITRGNVLDMAVGVIIATAFGKITASLVGDVFMPFIGWIIGDIDLAALNITLRPAVFEGGVVVQEALTLGVGTFLSTVINFILIALLVFVIIKTFNAARKRLEHAKQAPPDEPPTPSEEAALLAEIRDLLKK